MPKVWRQRLPWMLTLLILLSALFDTVAAGAAQSSSVERPERKIQGDLIRQLDRSDGDVPFLVQFRDQPDTGGVARAAAVGAQPESRRAAIAQMRTAVVDALRDASNRANSQVQDLVKELTAEGHIKSAEPLWIANALIVTGDRTAVLRLAARTEVSGVALDRRVAFVPPQTEQNITVSSLLPWNIAAVNAPDAWALGGDGTGVVVGVLDTGVEYEHPALMERFRGYNPAAPGSPDLTGNWLDVVGGKASPYDDVGHGTHVTGTILGYDRNAGLHIGVAPRATWIAVKAFDEEGAYDSWLLRAGQWLMAPTDGAGVPHPEWAPDIINNSWGGAPGADEFYRTMVQNWRTAGILPVFAAGNEGPGPATLVPPGNYPESFSVAAVDGDNALAWFSSRGPSPYSGVQKPNLSAPGVSIYSSLPGKTYGYYSGTSMAAPHVAGVAAAMLSAAPGLTLTELETALTHTATPLTDDDYPQTPNDGYGAGLVNAQAAVAATANTGRLLGAVRDRTGTPLAATLTLSPGTLSTTSSATDGSYQLTAKTGDYTLTAAASGYEPQSVPVTVLLHTTTRVDFSLVPRPRGALTGRVTDQKTGQPIGGASVSLPADPQSVAVLTDADGNYALNPWVGESVVRIQAAGYEPQVLNATIVAGANTLDAALVPVRWHLDDWMQNRGNAAHTGYNDSLLTVPLQTLWSAGDSAAGWASTLVVGGRVFSVSLSTKQVVAFDGSTGAQLWAKAIGGAYAAPGIAFLDDVLIVPDSDGNVSGLDPATGSTLWSVYLRKSPPLTYAAVESAPAVNGDLVYVSVRDNGYQVVAMDKTGIVHWQHYSIGSVGSVGDGKVFTTDEGITAMDAGTGVTVWQWLCGCNTYSITSTVYADSTVLLATGWLGDNILYAVDSTSGKLRWTLDSVADTPVVRDGYAYVPRTTGYTSRVRLKDGLVEESLAVDGATLLANGLLFGSGTAFDLTAGKTAWTFGSGGGPVLGHNLLILHSTKLTALAPATVGGALTGQVRDRDSGDPLSGAQVRLDGTPRMAETGADGAYSLAALPGSYLASASAYGYNPASVAVTITAGGLSEQEITMQALPRGTILGKVVEGYTNLPVEGAVVRLLEDDRVAPVATGPTGEFRLDAYSGPYTLETTRPGHETVLQSVTIPVHSSVNVTVTLNPLIPREDDWPTQYGPPDHTGQNQSMAAPPLTVAWKSSGLSIETNTRPVVGDGRVYVVTGGLLQAYELATGKFLWSQPGARSMVSPAYESGRVYMITGQNMVTAYDGLTGKQLWSTPLSQSFADSSPTAVGGKVFVTGDGGGATLYAIDGTNGRTLWSRNYSGGSISPVVSGDVVYVSGGGPHTYAYTADTGQLLWANDGCSCSTSGGQQAVVGAGLVLFVDPSHNQLDAIDAATGVLRWQRADFLGTPIVVDGLVYAYSYASGQVERIDPQQGQTTALYALSGRLAAGGGYLFGDSVKAINLATGSASISQSGATDVVVAEDLVVAITSDRNLVVLRPTTPVSAGRLIGKVLGQAVPDQPLAATVTVNGRTLATNPADGSFSIRLKPGTYTVAASAPRWVTASKQVTVTAGVETGVALVLNPEPLGNVSGSLTDGFTGRPVTSATVTLAEDPGAPAPFTGSLGSYQLGWYAGHYTLRVEAPGYRVAYMPVTLTSGAAVTADVVLVPGVTSDCPSDRCSPDRSGRSPALGTYPYTLAWTSSLIPNSQPAMGAGMVFVSNGGGWVTALDLFTGEQVWTTRVSTSPDWAATAPAYGDGKVFVGDANGYEYAFDALKGELLWKVHVVSGGNTYRTVYDQGRVFFAITGTSATIYALDADTGAQLWVQAGLTSLDQVVVADGRLYAADYGPRVSAFDEQTGKRLWLTDESTGFKGMDYYDLTLAQGVLVIGPELVNNNLIAYDAATGAHLWNSTGSTPAAKDGLLYTYVNGSLKALDLHTGALQWSIPVTVNGENREPMIVGNTLLLGNALAIDLATHQVVWSYVGGGRIPPTPGEGFLLVTNPDGKLVALRGTPTVRVNIATNGIPEGGGATVTLTGPGQSAIAVSDRSGQVSFAVAPSTTYQITVQKSSYPARTVTVAVGTTPADVAVNLSTDFNQDGAVDIADLLFLIDAWGTNNPALDLIPDGRIDLQDLYALAQSISP